MNSTEKLLMTVLKGIIPAETIAFLQPDNLRKILTTVGEQINLIKAQQADILNTQKQILEILNERNNRGSDTGNVVAIGTGTGG